MVFTWGIFLGTASGQEVLIETPAGAVKPGDPFRVVLVSETELDNFYLANMVFGGLELLSGPVKSSSFSTKMVNGVKEEERKYSYLYELRAPGPGQYEIGHARTGILSGPTTVTASGEYGDEPGEAELSATDLFLRAVVDRGQVAGTDTPVRLYLKIYTRQGILGTEEPEPPCFEGFRVEELNTEHYDWWQEAHDSRIYRSRIVKEYLLYPQRTGSIRIEPIEMIFGTEAVNPGTEAFFQPQANRIVYRKVQSEPLVIEVREP